MNFFIKTYGCQMNVNDSEKMRHILENRGLTYVEHEDEADVIIINSCAVREKPQEKIFSYAGRFGKDKIIIAAGCVAQAEKAKILERNPNIDYVVGTHQYYHIGDILDEIGAQAGGAQAGVKPGSVKTRFSRQWQELVPDAAFRSSPVTAFLSIMEGCDNFCSYCIVPFTRGREKHRPFKAILEEARYLAGNGFQEIILLGQNVNNWQDEAEGIKFHHLLDKLAQQIPVKWIRFITSYPGYHDEEVIEVMARNRNIARSIHFPAQSGSTRILKKMNRVYTRSQYLDIIQRFKSKMPDITFSSDFIVGFPGESDYDFQLTLSLLDKVEYENIFSFLYSPRKYTKAFKQEDAIGLDAKKQRLYQLQERQKQIQLKNNRSLKCQVVEVLVTMDHPKKSDEKIGRTEHYRVVNFKTSTPVGCFTRVKIESVGPYSLRGIEMN